MVSVEIIKLIGSGNAIGIDSKSTKYIVLYGQLFMHEKIQVVEVEQGLLIPHALHYELHSLQFPYVDEDNLVHCVKLKEHEKSTANKRVFSLDEKMVFIEYAARPLYELALNNDLIGFSRLRLSQTWVVQRAGLTLKGVPFIDLMKKAFITGEESARLISPATNDWNEPNILAHFIIRMVKNGPNEMAFHSWQVISDSPKLHYVHGIIDSVKKLFIHLDFAFHQTTSEEIDSLLLQNNWKPKLTDKEKIFRLDGQIEFTFGFDLMKLFFPSQTLVQEFKSKTLYAQ